LNGLNTEWGGIDTMIVAAGVSALLPLMEVAGVKSGKVEKSGIQHVVDVAALATRGNYVGPLVAAVTFVRVFFFIQFSKENTLLMLDFILDPAPPVFFPTSVDPPRKFPCLRHPRADAHALRVYQSRIPAPLPGPLNRAPVHRIHAISPQHH
jgi:hypothetical protein